jgi:hypothetical protein
VPAVLGLDHAASAASNSSYNAWAAELVASLAGSGKHGQNIGGSLSARLVYRPLAIAAMGVSAKRALAGSPDVQHRYLGI